MDFIFRVIIPIFLILIICGFNMKKIKGSLNTMKEQTKNCSNCTHPCHSKMSCNRKANQVEDKE